MALKLKKNRKDVTFSIVPEYITDKSYDDLAPKMEIYQNVLPGSIS